MWAERPTLDDPGIRIRLAFIHLSTCRTAAGAVPWTAVHEWCRIKGLMGPAAEHMIAILLAIDAGYREHARKVTAAEEG